MKTEPTKSFQTIPLGKNYDYLAPDGSEIRLLPDMNNGGMSHCTLPVGQTSDAVKHQTVEEIWYILSGRGEIWRKNDVEEQIQPLKSDVTVTIPVGTAFQFRNKGNDPLSIIIATMPPWPGSQEAVKVEGFWK